jgi:hypothetical protein
LNAHMSAHTSLSQVSDPSRWVVITPLKCVDESVIGCVLSMPTYTCELQRAEWEGSAYIAKGVGESLPMAPSEMSYTGASPLASSGVLDICAQKHRQNESK